MPKTCKCGPCTFQLIILITKLLTGNKSYPFNAKYINTV